MANQQSCPPSGWRSRRQRPATLHDVPFAIDLTHASRLALVDELLKPTWSPNHSVAAWFAHWGVGIPRPYNGEQKSGRPAYHHHHTECILHLLYSTRPAKGSLSLQLGPADYARASVLCLHASRHQTSNRRSIYRRCPVVHRAFPVAEAATPTSAARKARGSRATPAERSSRAEPNSPSASRSLSPPAALPNPSSSAATLRSDRPRGAAAFPELAAPASRAAGRRRARPSHPPLRRAVPVGRGTRFRSARGRGVLVGEQASARRGWDYAAAGGVDAVAAMSDASSDLGGIRAGPVERDIEQVRAPHPVPGTRLRGGSSSPSFVFFPSSTWSKDLHTAEFPFEFTFQQQ
ncbi:hypothetical protein HU200_012734 [Digitaria exilis]|uniref:Uncharacterized protein n=1 Tax=Digitaria exilis TaxID=1010633 RepID=A0A835FE74_9POAL|nr:hypothetical protein HU200_012734 [Digitaria exilis]